MALSSRQEAILAAVPDIIMEVDKHKVYTWANKAGIAFFGDDVIGKEAAFYFEGEQTTYTSVQPLFEGSRDLVYVESWQRRKDGKGRLLAWWCRVLKDGTGSVTGARSSARDITEQRKAEEALRASEERFSKAFHLSPLSIAISTLPDGVYREVNESFLRFTGYTREEVIGRTSVDLRLWVDEPLRQKIRQKLAAGNELKELPVVLRTRSGVLRDALYSAVTIQLGGVDHVFSLVLDITERKQAEEARRKSQEHLQQILNRPDCMLWRASVTETDGQFLWEFEIPPSGLQRRIFGAPAGVVHEGVSGVKARSLYGDFIVPEQAEMDTCCLAALRSGEPGYDQAYRLIKGTQTFWLHERVSITSLQSGRWDLVGITIDMTAQHVAEQARTASEAQLRQVLEHAGCLLWQARVVENAAGALDWVLFIPRSSLYRELFGDDPSEHPSLMWGDLNAPELAEMNVRSTAAIRGGAPGYEQGFRAIRNARTYWLHEQVSITPVKPGEWNLVGIITNVTAQHEAEQASNAIEAQLQEELQRSARLESIGILAGGIAHDFNNILTAIMGNLTLALLDAEALPKTERYLREAERATLRARDLTQQLLTFAKGGDPVRSEVRLPEIITEVVKFALHGSRAKGEFDLPDGLWLADADKGQLGQVVQNLVINAAQAMPEGGTIHITARNEAVADDSHRPLAPGDYVHISVADTGTGIKAEHLAKIFDPYFTTKQQGSGLGLTIVYSIIRKHNGHIEVESELGRGTTFHFWLPALREPQVDLPEDRVEATKPLKGRVLFMDDEGPIIQMAGLLLQRLGFDVEVARDGSEAVQKFEAAHSAGRPFDLVVMDLTVPGGMGGREAMEHLRRIDPGVKAIVSSGYSSDPVLANYRMHGFRGMVVKPFKIEDLTRVLREAMRESRSPIPGKAPGRPEGG
jgi:PAS domain S-box-containing protein